MKFYKSIQPTNISLISKFNCFKIFSLFQEELLDIYVSVKHLK